MQYEKKMKKIYSFLANYKPDQNNEEKVKIIDKKFIKRNNNKCKLIYKNKIFELKECLEDIDTKYNHKDSFKIKLIFIDNLIDMSYMFLNCYSLISLSINNKKDINENDLSSQIKIINMNYMFYGCNSLKSIFDIFQWDTSKVENMSFMFCHCKSLISLPDISNWNTSNAKNMSFMFCDCKSLISLPDLSNWDTSNAKNMSFMFCDCMSLISLPDLSNWNTSNVKSMSFMFNKCESLISLPEFYLLYKHKNDIIFKLTYKKSEPSTTILDSEFVERNKNKGAIIYNNIKYGLTNNFENIDNNYNEDLFQILL